MCRSLRGPTTEQELRAGYVVHWCPNTPGFGLRVSKTGDRAFIAERRVEGKTIRRTLGKAMGGKAAGAISIDAARKLQVVVSSELQGGVDRAEVTRERRKSDKLDALTLAAAVEMYVKGKKRDKDGLGLKERTKSDYLGMIAKGGTKKDGEPLADGMLYCISKKSIQKLTAAQIREAYAAAERRGARQAVYAMQVLRAVLNWHGVHVPNSPLDRNTAGRDQIVMTSSAGKPKPIPPERLKAWWKAASAHAGDATVDGLRFILLTGCRPGEVFGNAHEPGLLVKDVDLLGKRLVMVDTKNRRDHDVALSSQAFEIVEAHCKGKGPRQNVFDDSNRKGLLSKINSTANVKVSSHRLRHTFASIAAEIVSSFALKKMMNHTNAGDVTGTFYVGSSENQLRLGWQSIADFICSES